MSNKSVLSQRKGAGKNEFAPIIMSTRSDVYRMKSIGTGKLKQRKLREPFAERDGQIYRIIMYAGNVRYVRVLFKDEKEGGKR